MSADPAARSRKNKSSFARFLRNLTRWTSIGYFSSMKRRIWVLEQAMDALLESLAPSPPSSA